MLPFLRCCFGDFPLFFASAFRTVSAHSIQRLFNVKNNLLKTRNKFLFELLFFPCSFALVGGFCALYEFRHETGGIFCAAVIFHSPEQVFCCFAIFRLLHDSRNILKRKRKFSEYLCASDLSLENVNFHLIERP